MIFRWDHVHLTEERYSKDFSRRIDLGGSEIRIGVSMKTGGICHESSG
jgi:hypothetical protein